MLARRHSQTPELNVRSDSLTRPSILVSGHFERVQDDSEVPALGLGRLGPVEESLERLCEHVSLRGVFGGIGRVVRSQFVSGRVERYVDFVVARKTASLVVHAEGRDETIRNLVEAVASGRAPSGSHSPNRCAIAGKTRASPAPAFGNDAWTTLA